MQFKVPQFLEIEDKIFGPFTFKEFAYLAGGAGLCFTLYKLLGLLWGIIPMLILAGFSLMLTFYRPNNKPFLNMIESGLNYFTQITRYIWQQQKEKPAGVAGGNKNIKKTEMMPQGGLKLSGDKLRDLAWSLDVMDLSKKQDKL